MATGDIVAYPQFRLGNMLNTTNIAGRDLTDTNVKLAILKSTWVPATNFSTTKFMSEANVLLATHQVATGGTSYTGPITLTTTAAQLNASDEPEFRADDITLAKDASGFTDGQYWIVYYDSSVTTTSPVICYGDFGAAKNLTLSSLEIDFSNVGDAVNTLLRW